MLLSHYSACFKTTQCHGILSPSNMKSQSLLIYVTVPVWSQCHRIFASESTWYQAQDISHLKYVPTIQTPRIWLTVAVLAPSGPQPWRTSRKLISSRTTNHAADTAHLITFRKHNKTNWTPFLSFQCTGFISHTVHFRLLYWAGYE